MANQEIEKIFFDATKLLFPRLRRSDSRYLKVAEYARTKYFSNANCRICVLCAINGKSKCFHDFFEFCQENNLRPGKKEVIISDMGLFFTKDYRKRPKLVS